MSRYDMEGLNFKIQEAEFYLDTKERRAFKKHLDKVAAAIRLISRVDSGDEMPGAETKAIIDCIGNAKLLASVVEEAKQNVIELQSLIYAAEAKP